MKFLPAAVALLASCAFVNAEDIEEVSFVDHSLSMAVKKMMIIDNLH
jgi:hypothetical protein